MILADTSVWIDHLHSADQAMQALLDSDDLVIHPFVIGELACGSLRHRDVVLTQLDRLPALKPVADQVVIQLIESHSLWGKGFSLIDIHLLATCMDAGVKLWTRDKALAKIAHHLGVGH